MRGHDVSLRSYHAKHAIDAAARSAAGTIAYGAMSAMPSITGSRYCVTDFDWCAMTSRCAGPTTTASRGNEPKIKKRSTHAGVRWSTGAPDLATYTRMMPNFCISVCQMFHTAATTPTSPTMALPFTGAVLSATSPAANAATTPVTPATAATTASGSAALVSRATTTAAAPSASATTAPTTW